MSSMSGLMTYAIPTVAFACAVHALLRLRSQRSAASAAPSAAASTAAQAGEDARSHGPAARDTLHGILDAFTHVRRRLPPPDPAGRDPMGCSPRREEGSLRQNSHEGGPMVAMQPPPARPSPCA